MAWIISSNRALEKLLSLLRKADSAAETPIHKERGAAVATAWSGQPGCYLACPSTITCNPEVISSPVG